MGLAEIEGVVESLIFHNESNGYTVARFRAEDETITVVGTLPGCAVGLGYVLRGVFAVHPKFGEQFQIKEAEQAMPSSRAGIVSFLSSGVIKGIGPKKANAIVEAFGDDTLSVIENDPDRLTKVSGIGKKRAKLIYEAYMEHRIFADVAIALQKYDISSNVAMKLYETYGADTVSVVEMDPYQLAEDIYGMGFIKVDAIARKMGYPDDDERRIRCGMLYVLSSFVREGHSFMPREEFLDAVTSLLDVPRETAEDELASFAFGSRIKVDELDGAQVIYPMNLYEAEQDIVAGLRMLSESPLRLVSGETDSVIDMAQKDMNLRFSDEQKEAIKIAINNGVSVITGGPGTGKTTIIRGILQIFEENGIDTAVTAPTGRAAKRIHETTGYEALTVHRLLGYHFDDEANMMMFSKDENNPLEQEVIIVDEASMMDLEITRALLAAMKPGMRLILVGDADQLPSVGAGNVLFDIIDSEYIYSIALKDIFRQAEESLIVVNAHRINAGEYPVLNEKDKDFYMLSAGREKEMADTILELTSERLPSHYTEAVHDRLSDIQVITPTKKGAIGTVELNIRLQERLNPSDPSLKEKSFGRKTFREGDKVMQIRNDYELKWHSMDTLAEGDGVFNGDVGFISEIDNESERMAVIYDDKLVKYDFDKLDELELAYAMTVHKSQGSEFPIIVMPISYFPPMLATRNLIYTAITRAKELVVLVGSQVRLNQMVDNDQIAHRNSGLGIRLRKLLFISDPA